MTILASIKCVMSMRGKAQAADHPAAQTRPPPSFPSGARNDRQGSRCYPVPMAAPPAAASPAATHPIPPSPANGRWRGPIVSGCSPTQGSQHSCFPFTRYTAANNPAPLREGYVYGRLPGVAASCRHSSPFVAIPAETFCIAGVAKKRTRLSEECENGGFNQPLPAAARLSGTAASWECSSDSFENSPGPSAAIRCAQPFDHGHGDYTAERQLRFSGGSRKASVLRRRKPVRTSTVWSAISGSFNDIREDHRMMNRRWPGAADFYPRHHRLHEGDFSAQHIIRPESNHNFADILVTKTSHPNLTGCR